MSRHGTNHEPTSALIEHIVILLMMLLSRTVFIDELQNCFIRVVVRFVVPNSG